MYYQAVCNSIRRVHGCRSTYLKVDNVSENNPDLRCLPQITQLYLRYPACWATTQTRSYLTDKLYRTAETPRDHRIDRPPPHDRVRRQLGAARGVGSALLRDPDCLAPAGTTASASTADSTHGDGAQGKREQRRTRRWPVREGREGLVACPVHVSDPGRGHQAPTTAIGARTAPG